MRNLAAAIALGLLAATHASCLNAQPFSMAKFPPNVQNYINRIAVGQDQDAALYREFVTDPTFDGHGLLGAILVAGNINRDGPCPRTKGIYTAIQWDLKHLGLMRMTQALQPLARNPGLYAGHGGQTVLSLCGFQDSIQHAVRLQLLVGAGADINQKLADGNDTPAFFEIIGLANVLRGKDTTSTPLRNLLLLGADPNARDRAGRTPLMMLMRRDRFFLQESAEVLLWAGADANAKDAAGIPVIGHVAIRPGNDQDTSLKRLKFLRSAGADFSVALPATSEGDRGSGSFLERVLESGNTAYYRAAKAIIDGPAEPLRASGPFADAAARTRTSHRALVGTWKRTGTREQLEISDTCLTGLVSGASRVDGCLAIFDSTAYFASFNGTRDFFCNLKSTGTESVLEVDCSDRGKEKWIRQ